ncbi:MAG TPA: DUF4445 domain-containing protein, partial [Candidatus Aminicenantes bacterium]|nr:DUF4445 domain-containing protein [Candidatus Aminicenantes bacterium]
MSVILRTYDQKAEVEDPQQNTLLEMARNKGIFITSSCGEQGKCGQCLVDLIEGKFLINEKEISVSKDKPRRALACRTKEKSRDAVVEIPKSSLIEFSGKIVADFTVKHKDFDPPIKKLCLQVPLAVLESQESDRQRLEKEILKHISFSRIHIPLAVLRMLPFSLDKGDQRITVTLGRREGQWSVVNIEPGDTAPILYGVAVDIGTTTVVGGLVDMTKGEFIDKISLYNQQIIVAEDVISRISFIKSYKEVVLLRSLVVDKTINPMIKHLCRTHHIRREDISRAALSGNTIMMHLLLGLSPKSIGESPFQPVERTPGPLPARDVGLDISPDGIVDVMPSASGYIGGDITSDIYVSGLYEEKELSILIDIGTNGEIVMSDGDKMVACSTAAGPAFEGYGLYHGCRAFNGAVEKVTFDNDMNIRTKVIGGGKASGICGTGVIDFLAEGLRTGLINQMGRFDKKMLDKHGLKWEVREDGKTIKACIIAKEKDSALNVPVVISESDISKILQAKAAVYAALNVLLDVRGKTWRDIKKLFLAGGFGKHIHFKNAVSIGLVPPVPEDRV